MGVKPLWMYDWHVCSCNKWCWRPLHPRLWKVVHQRRVNWLAQQAVVAAGQQQHDVDEEHSCPRCRGPRFLRTDVPGTRRFTLKPRMVGCSYDVCTVHG